MNVFAQSSLIAAVSNLGLGIFVYLSGSKSPINRTFALMTFCMVVWSTEVFGLYFFSNEYFAEVWANVLRTGLIFIPYTVFHWFLTLTRDESKHRRVLLYTGYILGIGFSCFNWTSYFVVPGLVRYRWGYYPQTGPLYSPFMLTFFFYTFYGLYLVYKRSKTTRSHVERNRLKYVLLGASCAILVGSFNFLPMFGIDVYPIGNLANVVYVGITATAIVKHRLMDINIFIKKSVTYSFLIFLLSIPLVIIINFSQNFFFGNTNFLFSFIVFVLFVIATFVFPILKPGTEKTIEQLLFRGKYDYKKTLNQLSKAMISILEKETLLTKIIDTTTDAMGVKKASIFLLNEEKGGYYVQCSRGLNKAVDEELKFLKSDPFITWLRAKGEIVVTEELERYNNSQGIRETIEILRSMESEICIPLTTSRELIGFCNLGKKKSGEMFSHEDIDLLETLGNNAAIAIENAKLYEDLKKSESQVRRADRLASLGILTAGLAHEIRNPLVAIKTFTQLLPERLDDIEFREHFLKVTAGEVDRLSSLVNELLTFARPSEPNLQMENINDVAEKMILLVKTEAKKKNLKINTRYSNDVSDTMVDKEQIKQVLLNLFLNAIQATPENGTITFETRQVRKNSSTDYVQMEIRDTGTGIPKDDIEHIFTPFFTTKNEGSGLGLSICHRIIEEHSGYIEVESTEGEGTTFYINFPMNPAKDVLSSSIRTAANSGDGRP